MTFENDPPAAHQDRNAAPAGQDEVEDYDGEDNLQDADTLADLADPPLDPRSANSEMDGSE